MEAKDTRQRVLDAARLTVQDRGYAGLSFRDLAEQIGIKSASVHHHFPTKGDLGAVVAARYTADFAAYLDGVLDESPDTATCIRRYTDVFRRTLQNDNRMCLGGIMAAEYRGLPDEVRLEVVKFSEMNVAWLVRALSPGKGTRATGKTLRRRALAIFAAIEGAQLVARSRGDVAVYEEIVASYRDSGLLP